MNLNDDDAELLRKIYQALIGDEKLGQEGLVKMVKRHDRWIESAKLKMAAILGGSAVVIFLIDHFLNH